MICFEKSTYVYIMYDIVFENTLMIIKGITSIQ